MSTVHDFQESLAKSQAQADAPWWLEVYRKAFPDLQSSVCVRQDGWAQRGGIDRVLTLSSGKTLTIDEKVRENNWPDIALESWSQHYGYKDPRNVPGWAAKKLACDFIAYAFVPSATCYLLPFQTLRRAFMANYLDWKREHGELPARNNGYQTLFVPVPIPVLMAALADAMEVKWNG